MATSAEPTRAGGPVGRGSLLVRTNLVLGISAFTIILIAMLALDRFVLQPILERAPLMTRRRC